MIVYSALSTIDKVRNLWERGYLDMLSYDVYYTIEEASYVKRDEYGECSKEELLGAFKYLNDKTKVDKALDKLLFKGLIKLV